MSTLTLSSATPTIVIDYGPAPKGPATTPKKAPRKTPDAPKGLEFDRMFDAGRIEWVGDVPVWR